MSTEPAIIPDGKRHDDGEDAVQPSGTEDAGDLDQVLVDPLHAGPDRAHHQGKADDRRGNYRRLPGEDQFDAEGLKYHPSDDPFCPSRISRR